ncbi:hypothetical protein RRG08_048707 [Elysia crispata]|uniref:Uncharacterized protein n=1 Tax=Elysia crispata TaxID=231223 RepID=A0AAE1DTE1_9GAST|nr:hypothetical protein RRG08_048707 [Elysia crispata]
MGDKFWNLQGKRSRGKPRVERGGESGKTTWNWRRVREDHMELEESQGRPHGIGGDQGRPHGIGGKSGKTTWNWRKVREDHMELEGIREDDRIRSGRTCYWAEEKKLAQDRERWKEFDSGLGEKDYGNVHDDA